ncbi:3'-5' exonuclease [Anaerofustis stercorihominis]|uniref:3'-5' exonuclease n=2 Tax=Anaerofustis stercorihominis TaxID=214853 RepID=A0A3E3DUJ7_9FIRM|nr:3'-5' exonuclease [Anaerofustis stercorihominis]
MNIMMDFKYRKYKGKDMFDFPEDYTVIDIETTGLNPDENEIIEVGAVKVRDRKIIDEFSSFVSPKKDIISPEIRKLTGIDEVMIEGADQIEDVIPKFNEFIDGEILLGHNVNFDINFLYDNYERYSDFYLSNDYVDLLKISRKLSPEFENHKLETVLKKLGIKVDQQHRAVSDCIDAHHCFEKYRETIIAQYGDVSVYKMIFNL